ncbi:MAG: putative metal-binding motif-containing protein [Myxococcota bacterium]|nr:putative metal-binding motif-containing protein [Myxococcota bacterium]
MSIDQTNADNRCICPESTCSYDCRLRNDLSQSCEADTRDTALACDEDNQEPYDPTGTEFKGSDSNNPVTYFYQYAFDCDDEDNGVYPGATEECDGVLNDCNQVCGDNPSDCEVYTSATPQDEIDLDNDTFVACSFQGGTWRGSSAPQVGSDCSPNDQNVFPNAVSVCDGQYNDCNLWSSKHIYAVDFNNDATISADELANPIDDCYCNTDACDVSGGDICLDSNGASCEPKSYPLLAEYDYSTGIGCYCVDDTYTDCKDNSGDVCVPVTQGDCFCPSSNCQIDTNSDDVSDCVDLQGNVCVPVDTDNDGVADVYGSGQTAANQTINGNTYLGVCSGLEVLSECQAQIDLFSAGAPDDQIDNDGDCYVECYNGNTQWAGSPSLIEACTASTGLDPNGTRTRPISGLDCDDSIEHGQSIYPNAEEICDGLYNDCSAAGWSATSLPSDESDNDSDGYVICEIDVSGWDGDGTVVGGEDCDDNRDTRYPSANEICDGMFNDCESEFLNGFAGASGEDCFCTDTNSSNCQTATGDSCTPDATHESSTASSHIELSAPPDAAFPYQYVECFCLNDNCKIDEDGDGLTDCLHADRSRCEPIDDNGDGFADTCLTDTPSDLAQTFTSIAFYSDYNDGAPGREIDDDGDNYVECNYNSSLWVGSPFVSGGSDCFDDQDDLGARVYPGATDLCDGLFNDCTDGDFSLTSIPESEQDLDGDGWIGCDPDDNSVANTPWSVEVAENPTRYTDIDEDCFCGGLDSDGDNMYDSPDTTNCVDSAGVECNPCANPADPSQDLDSTTCLDGLVQVGGFADCNDTDATVYPSALEYCDGQWNNCVNAESSTRDAPLDEIDNDGDGQVECRYYQVDAAGCTCSDYLRSDATRDCVDLEGNACTPIDADGDGEPELESIPWAGTDAVTYADCQDTGTNAASVYYGADEVCDAQFNDCSHPMIASNPVTGGNYRGVVSDCLCVEADCRIDIDNDSISDCVDLAGDICDPVDVVAPFNYADDCTAELNDAGVEVNNVSYKGAVPDCYCATTNCLSDTNSDGVVDCYTPTGDICDANYNSDATGFESCVSDDSDLQFSQVLGTDPFEEVDNDGDNYVECTEFDLTTWRDQGGSVLVVGGSDCDDLDENVYPTAVELCDGQLNACPSDPADYVATDLPTTEIDDDGDGFVDCSRDNGETWVDAETDPENAAAHYVDDNDCYCDGDCALYTNSQDSPVNCIDLTGSSCEPDVNSCVSIGGFGDCDDDPTTGVWVFPDAPGLCDGRYNDCLDTNFSTTEIPSDEVDSDGDGYVTCSGFDSGTWTGDSAVVGGDDCVDSGTAAETIYPGAVEECDGLFNDCENLQQDAFEGVVGDCYCQSSDCQIDIDGDTVSDCLDSSGNTCDPIDRNLDGLADYCTESSVAIVLNGIDHFGVEAECHCPTSDCELESSLDSNSTLDCLTPEGLVCNAQDDGFGFAEDCAMGAFSHVFTGYNGATLTAPMNEIDHDRDDYVECAYGVVAWQGSPSVIGGDDCYDYDDLVYPAASIEYCDGQYNDCSDLLYDTSLGHFENLAPPEETDDDSDGFVECDRTYNETWVNPDIAPVTGFGDCDDTESLVYPYADEICDGQFNNCEDTSYVANSAPDNEIDTDGDGYVVCTDFDSSTWGGDGNVIGGSDCDESLTTGSTVYPNAPEVCDGQFNNCDHPQQFDFLGVVSDCFCPSSDCQIDITGDGISDCVDSDGLTCTPVDTEGNNYADSCEASLTAITVANNDYYSMEVGCYCPTEDCQLDVVDDDYTFDCITPDGYECPSTVATDNGLGFAEDCASLLNATIAPHEFLQDNGLALTAPFFELDNDSDNHVECEYVAAAWEGSLNIQGGSDCDDADDTVYPLADEVCDGQYNDCDNGWVANGAPGDEVDNDEDGWVECTRELNVEWQPWDTAEEPNIVHGSDGSNPLAPYCVCQDENCTAGCVDEAGNDCFVTPGYCDPVVFTYWGDCDDTSDVVAPFAAEFEYSDGISLNASLCMRDADYDGYGDSNIDTSSDPTDLYAGHDCDDSNLLVRPQQDETCEAITEEQIDSDCNGDVNTADSPYGLVNALQNLYRDADLDGFGDPSIVATPACVVASGFVFNATDCDDTDPDTYPGAPEVCDGADQDCDLTIDEPESLAEPSISRCTYMYRDQDTDGYGDEDQSMCLCQEGSDPSVEEGGYTYIIYSGDCWDSSSEIKPLSCHDGIDNDNDGFPDELDVDCLNGYVEDAQGDWSSENKEEVTELLDGHDNDCDGFVSAIELDCDDDGTFPQVPADNFTFDRSAKFQRASDLSLEACDPNIDGGYELQCWGENLRLECDKLTADIVFGEGDDGEDTSTISYNGTGLWMLNISESSDGFTGRFDGGYRKYPEGKTCTNSLEADCDDHCALRCPGQSEVCDGIDNNCSGVDIASDQDGIPDALDTEVAVSGLVSPAEMDIDLDGFLACDSFASNRTETQFSDSSCTDDITIAEENDCNNFCFYTSPASEERCDGFLGVCGGDPEGLDEDRDDYRTCGAWSGEGSSMTEDVFAVVWLKDVDWTAQGSDEVELIRPNSDAPSPEDMALERTDSFNLPGAGDANADTAEVDSGLSDSGVMDSGLCQEAGTDILPNFGESLPIINAGNGWVGGDVEIDELQDMIPLIIPRFKAPDCDSELLDQLTLLLGEERVTRILDPGPSDNPSELILDACQKQGAAGCALVKLSLSEDADSNTYDTIDQSTLEIPAFSNECRAKPEQWISRTVWQRERIVSTRETVVEWECQRIYGRDCDEVADATPMKPNWMDTMVSAERWLLSDRVWWKELGRFNPEPIVFGTVMSCWGNPTDPTSSISSETGGDCNDEVKRAHRDLSEGPGDLVGQYQNGELTDCATCLDGIDNNCDGAIDCADPACARCFVGQGVGCGGGTESPCAQGGCSAPAPSGTQRMYNSIALFILSLCAVSYRRRKIK